MSTPLIIEVRANEFATRNEHIPYGASNMIADALECAQAGATGYHWHSRGEDGIDDPRDAELHRAVIDGIRARSEMFLHPSLGFNSTQGDAGSRLAVIRKVMETGSRPDIVPIDFGAFIADAFDAGTGTFGSLDAAVLNRTGYLQDLASGISELGLAVLAVVWSAGGIRTAQILREQSILTARVVWQLGFTGPRVPGGPPATGRQLDAFLDELPADEPWNIHVRDGDGLPMAAEAILRGGHVSIGLGDDPYERLGKPSNADLVSRIVDIAETVGRPVADVPTARRLLGLTAADHRASGRRRSRAHDRRNDEELHATRASTSTSAENSARGVA